MMHAKHMARALAIASGVWSTTASPLHAEKPEAHRPSANSDLILRGGQEGTAFKSLTIEGEDRVHVEFERPALELGADAQQAPGLELGSAMDVLDRTRPDIVSPLIQRSAKQACPYLARPWLQQLASGSVARFRPAVEGVERWKLLVASSRGETVASFQGNGQPPAEVVWDGRTRSGAWATPGLMYSYVFEAYDRAGNKRNFVGDGFELSAYRVETPGSAFVAFSGHQLASAGERSNAAPSGRALAADAAAATTHTSNPLLLEVASWINQRPTRAVRVTASARTFDQANALASQVTRGLVPLLLGGESRLQSQATAAPDAPQDGTLQLTPVP